MRFMNEQYKIYEWGEFDGWFKGIWLLGFMNEGIYERFVNEWYIKCEWGL